jgi:hypothetical protein
VNDITWTIRGHRSKVCELELEDLLHAITSSGDLPPTRLPQAVVPLCEDPQYRGSILAQMPNCDETGVAII